MVDQTKHTHVLLLFYFLLNNAKGKQEDFVDMLRSIIAQLELTETVNSYAANGIFFNKFLHIPEEHPHTKEIICMREDEGHLFKVILLSSVPVHNDCYIIYIL